MNIPYIKQRAFLKYIILLMFIVFIYLFISKKYDIQITIVPGEKITTYGFADISNMKYPNKSFIVIDDKTYPNMNQKLNAFKTAVKGNNFVIISGDIDLSNGKINDFDHSYFDEFNDDNTPQHKNFVVSIGSNTTLVGLKDARIMYGEILLSNVENIIIQNISFYDAHGAPEQNPKTNKQAKCSCDNIRVEKANNLWINHCSFSDGKCYDIYGNYHDGAIDITSGQNITISYCHFTNHNKLILLTPSDDFAKETNVYLTLHHNYFNKVIQRIPRARWANVHVYNNLYKNIGNKDRNFGYSLGIGIGCNFIVENNFFENSQYAIIDWFDKSKIKEQSLALLYYKGNIPSLKDEIITYSQTDELNNYKIHLKEEKVFIIPYYYELEDSKLIKRKVAKYAGVKDKIKIRN